MEKAYTAIGRAILEAQLFEIALVPIYEMHRIHNEENRRAKTQGFIPAGEYKNPITNKVKFLKDSGVIAEELADRLILYTENRHLLVHRWVLENGIPQEGNQKDFLPLLELANRVESESKELTRLFLGYVLKYAEPTWAAENMNEYKLKMKEVFKNAHLEI